MKTKITFLSVLALAAITLLSFTLMLASGIKGTVTPAENAGDVWAISGNDSLKATPVQGAFQFNDAKPGVYTIIVEGKAPYKDFKKENVELKEGEVLDLGNITLNQ